MLSEIIITAKILGFFKEDGRETGYKSKLSLEKEKCWSNVENMERIRLMLLA